MLHLRESKPRITVAQIESLILYDLIVKHRKAPKILCISLLLSSPQMNQLSPRRSLFRPSMRLKMLFVQLLSIHRALLSSDDLNF